MSNNAAGERGSSDRPALTRLTGLSPVEFAGKHWGERPLLTRSDGGFDDLFSADAVDELVAHRGLRTPFVRMASRGDVLSPSLFTSSGGAGAEIADQLDSGKVLEQFAAGATLVLQGLHRTWQPLADFTRALVADLGHPAQVNAYITPDSSRGFDPHYDTHDVFVIQIAGAKRWRIHEPVLRHPLPSQPWGERRDEVAAAAQAEPAIDAVFEPGDVLYLPRGWLHSAVAQGGTSIHVTIGVRSLTRQDIVRHLLAGTSALPELRVPLALGLDPSDPSTFSADVEAGMAALRQMLEAAPDIAEIGEELGRTIVRETRPEPVAPLRTIDLMADLASGTVIGWRRSLVAQVDEDDGGVHVRTRTKSVTLPAEAAAAIHAVRSADQTAGGLPQLDEASSLVVARRLLREGIVVPR